MIVTGPALADSDRSTQDWPSATPPEVGLSESVLATFDTDIANGKYGYVDSMLVIRHGKVAYERFYEHDYGRIYGSEARTPGPLVVHDPTGPYNYFNPWWHPCYREGNLHTMQSVTKSVVSAVIGIAVGRKEFSGSRHASAVLFRARPGRQYRRSQAKHDHLAPADNVQRAGLG